MRYSILLAAIAAVFSTNGVTAADDGTDIIFFTGTLQNTTINLVSPSGIPVSTSGTFRVNDSTYDGLGGTDFLFMTGDADYLQSGKSINMEQFFASDGNDVFDGSDQSIDIVILGGAGGDILFGGSGNDSTYGSYGDDFIDGGSGNDILNGNDNNDTIYGGSGNDILDGGADNDQLFGGTGNDAIYGGLGDDDFHGISGNDFIVGEVDGTPDSAFDEIILTNLSSIDIAVSMVDSVFMNQYLVDHGFSFSFSETDQGYLLTILGETDSALITLDTEAVVLSDGTYTLASLSAVPIPAAAWLFGSGLLSLVGFSKRQVTEGFKLIPSVTFLAFLR